MTIIVRSTRVSSWIAALLFVSAATTASGQETPTAVAEPAPSPASPEYGEPLSTPAAPQPSAAADTTSELAALRAEVEALKAKQEEVEATALLSQSEGVESAGESELLRVYGFMDFGIDKYFLNGADGAALVRPTGATTFVFGNLNLYFDANPVEHLRTMVELRFTLAPNGEETQLGPPIGTSYERIDTTAFEFADPSSQSKLRLGGIFIERAYTEYQFSNLFKVQWGMFLTPFGIWNLDHGSPTLISLMLPEFIAGQMMPTRLLGVLVHGSAFFGSSEIAYALHVTNGRTPLNFDLSEDKALGGRVYFAHEGDFGRLVLGTSAYWGTYLDQQRAYTPMGKSFVSLTDVVDYTEEVLAFDGALDLGDFRLRSEGVMRWVRYHDGKSERSVNKDGSTGFLPNRLEYTGYVLAAYRTPWRVEPYVEAEVANKSAPIPRWAGTNVAGEANSAVVFLSVGFNIELTTHTIFKTQVVWDRAYDRQYKNKVNDCPILFIRVVDSF